MHIHRFSGWFLVPVVLALAVAVICFIPARLSLRLWVKQGMILAEAKLGFLGLTVWRRRKTWAMPDIVAVALGAAHHLDFHHLQLGSLRYFLRHIWCEALDVQARMGAGDPAATALCWGAAWALLGPARALLAPRWKGDSSPRFDLTPDFKNTTLELDARCILAARTGHYIIAGWLKLLEPASHNLVRGVANRGSTGRTASLIF